jgi:hypothetical protein
MAFFIVFFVKIGNYNVQMLVGPIDGRWFQDYSPYFTGMEDLQKNEVFSPLYTHKKKIILLGASSTDSIGCDYTWHEKTGEHNVHYACTIASQLNEILHEHGYLGWQVFNLAVNGGKLTNTLYIYTKLMELKPEIIILGDTFNYYMWENAGIGTLKPEQIAYLDKVCNASSETSAVWNRLRETLQKHGWQPDTAPAAPSEPVPLFVRRDAVTLNDLLIQSFVLLRKGLLTEGPPHTIAYSQAKWPFKDPPDRTNHEFDNPDPEFGYFQGVSIIANLQKKHGGQFLIYFSPYYGHRYDALYEAGLENIYGSYLEKEGIPVGFHSALELRPVYETYDGSHQTFYGNTRIAKILFNDLKTNHLLN